MKVPKFFVRNFKIIAICRFFITSYHALSLVITLCPLVWKENYFHLATLKLVPRLLFFYHISRFVTLCYTLSPRLERKPFFGNFKISFQAADFLSHPIKPCRSFSRLIILCPLVWKENHFHLAGLKLVPSL